MELWGNALLGGMSVGSMYSLLALGLALMWATMRIINFAHGDFYVFAGYIFVILFTKLKIPFVLVLVLICFLMMGVGFVSDRAIFRPLRRKAHLSILIATAGLSIAISNTLYLTFGPSPWGASSPFPMKMLSVLGVGLSLRSLAVMIVGIGLMVVFHLFLSRSFLGLQLRALAQDEDISALMGVNVSRGMILVVGLSAALAGVAAAFLAPILYVSYYGGVSMMLKGFIAATIGGLGSIAGAMVGGLLLGMAESAVGVYLSSGWRDAIIYASLIGLLAYFPNGIFGRR